MCFPTTTNLFMNESEQKGAIDNYAKDLMQLLMICILYLYA